MMGTGKTSGMARKEKRLPKGWHRERMKRMFDYAKGLNITKSDLVEDGIAVVSYGQIHSKQNTGTHLDGSLVRFVAPEAASEAISSRMKRGDIVLADTSEDLEGVGNCVLVDSDQVVYGGYHTIIAKARFPEHSKFLSYLFQTDAWRKQLRTKVCGIKVYSLTQRILNGVYILLPPLAEQERIAAFLDEKCTAIDKAIEVKQKQIANLEAMWNDVLYQAATQGIINRRRAPSTLPMVKPPKGWKVERLNSLFSYAKGLNITKSDLASDGVAVISYGQIHSKQNTGVHLDERLVRFIAPEMVSGIDGAKLKRGDIVFADTSEDLDGVGNCVLIDTDDVVFAGYHSIVGKARFPEYSSYLAYLFQTDYWRQQLRKQVCGIKVYSITQRVLNGVHVLVPPLPEQRRIVAYLDRRRAEIDRLAANLRRQVGVLEQYRKSLIHELVTGERRTGR